MRLRPLHISMLNIRDLYNGCTLCIINNVSQLNNGETIHDTCHARSSAGFTYFQITRAARVLSIFIGVGSDKSYSPLPNNMENRRFQEICDMWQKLSVPQGFCQNYNETEKV